MLKEINKNHHGKYDFFYMPIDFASKANVGYFFLNFVNPLYILDFFNEYNDRRWPKFKSPKVCHIVYARIQGLDELVKHFRGS